MMHRGFTLIEMLLVVTITTLLMTIILVGLQPAKRFTQSRNLQRQTDINSLLNAVSRYASDHKGLLPAGITTSVQTISNTGANICSSLLPLYLAALPVDPGTGPAVSTCSGTYNTNYQINSVAGGHVTLNAPAAENSEIITLTR